MSDLCRETRRPPRSSAFSARRRGTAVVAVVMSCGLMTAGALATSSAGADASATGAGDAVRQSLDDLVAEDGFPGSR